jgi:hypothetical protein
MEDYADVKRSSSAEQYDKYQRIGVYVNTYKSYIDRILSLYTIYVTKYHAIECISSANNYVLNNRVTTGNSACKWPLPAPGPLAEDLY